MVPWLQAQHCSFHAPWSKTTLYTARITTCSSYYSLFVRGFSSGKCTVLGITSGSKQCSECLVFMRTQGVRETGSQTHQLGMITLQCNTDFVHSGNGMKLMPQALLFVKGKLLAEENSNNYAKFLK